MMRPRHLLSAAMLLGLGACSALRPEPPIERDAAHRLDRGLAALEAGEYREAFHDLAWVYSHCPDHARGAQALLGLAALELDPRNRGGRPALATDLLGRVIREPASPDFVRPLAESTYLMALALGAPAASATGIAPGARAADAAARPGTTAAASPDTARPSPARRDTSRADTTRADTARVDTSRADTGRARTTRADSAWQVSVARAAEVLDAPAQEPAYGCGARIRPRGWAAPRLPELPGPTIMERLAAAERSRGAAAAEAEALRGELATARQKLQETEAELERIRKTLKP